MGSHVCQGRAVNAYLRLSYSAFPPAPIERPRTSTGIIALAAGLCVRCHTPSSDSLCYACTRHLEKGVSL